MLIAEAAVLVAPDKYPALKWQKGAHFFDRPNWPVLFEESTSEGRRSFAKPLLLHRLRRSVPGTERPPQGWEANFLRSVEGLPRSWWKIA